MDNAKPYQEEQTWETVKKLINGHRDEQELILDPGQNVSVVFIGEPYAYEAVFQEPDWVKYNPKYDLHKDIQPSVRILINLAIIDSDIKVKYFDMNVETFKELYHLRDKYGLDEWVYELVRLDDDVDSYYSITLGYKLDDDTRNRIKCLPRISLASVR